MPDKAQDDDVVMSLVELAMARPADEREAYLRSACATDSQLYGQAWKYVHWEERMRGFLLEPICAPLPEPHFEPGEILDNRFRIVREVGEGGMGIVYEAVDAKLERRIAIKCAKTGFRKRLPPEVRNAREIAHTNVCKIFEIHTASTSQGEIDFITMELLHGETLSERLRRGPLPYEEAREIGRQICAGLAEAHRNQVIHGDLKSNNVILTTGTNGAVRAVITDFGLARRPETSQQTAQSGDAGGTPDYMAPELWRGEKASVASDIYALGVILYELASGRRPYGSQPTVTGPSWEQRLTRKPPHVHPKWDGILLRCLEPDPARRLRSAEEVARALTPLSRRWMLGAAAAAVLAIAALLVPPTVPKESVRLAVLPFASAADMAPLAESLLRDASSQLARLKSSASRQLSVIPLNSALQSQVDTPEKARSVLGATHVLQGRLDSENGKVVLSASLTDARSLINAKQWRAKYAPGELRYVPTALAGLVTGAFRLPLLASVSTVNAAARQDYFAGLSLLRRNSGVDAALPQLERAVAADPDSPLPYAALAEAQRIKFVSTYDQLWLDRAQQSAREAERRNPDLAPVHRIAGLMLQDTGSYELAAAEYRRAIELEPGNPEGHRRLGQVCEFNNQLDDAVAAYRKAIEVGPDYYRNYQSFGSYYYKRANYSEAVRLFQKAVEFAPEEPSAHFALGTGYSDLGEFASAETELRTAIRLGAGDNPGALVNLAFVLMSQARDQEAIAYLTQLLSRWPERYKAWMNLGTSYRRTGRAADSERANRQGLALVEKELTRDPRDGKARSNLAYLCARLGDRRRAESEIAQALRLSSADSDVLWMAATTYEALGQRNNALGVLSAAPLGVLASLSRWPDVADLTGDHRFQQLLATRQIK